jgi:hypothetical protein
VDREEALSYCSRHDALAIKAIETQVIEKRAPETKEAIALPMDLVRVMEEYVVKFSTHKPQAAIFPG